MKREVHCSVTAPLSTRTEGWWLSRYVSSNNTQWNVRVWEWERLHAEISSASSPLLVNRTEFYSASSSIYLHGIYCFLTERIPDLLVNHHSLKNSHETSQYPKVISSNHLFSLTVQNQRRFVYKRNIFSWRSIFQNLCFLRDEWKGPKLLQSDASKM